MIVTASGWRDARNARHQPFARGSLSVQNGLSLGPQVATMVPDFAADADSDARRSFESLPTFYRKGYVRWIELAKRPETRA
jgi:hypothetical protein